MNKSIIRKTETMPTHKRFKRSKKQLEKEQKKKKKRRNEK